MTSTYQGIAQPGVNIQSEPATLSNHGETGDESRIEGLAGDCREAEADANRETPRPASLRRLKLGTSIIPRGGRVKPDP